MKVHLGCSVAAAACKGVIRNHAGFFQAEKPLFGRNHMLFNGNGCDHVEGVPFEFPFSSHKRYPQKNTHLYRDGNPQNNFWESRQTISRAMHVNHREGRDKPPRESVGVSFFEGFACGVALLLDSKETNHVGLRNGVDLFCRCIARAEWSSSFPGVIKRLGVAINRLSD